ncbi:hypothetical protein FKW77_006274 [Venturia effusa]|uniref:Uncharacterized protein n=1 Tax=Venturia effusa TaxID=50376 RepID=A0A517KWJ1_9PEZI|nr:hypothetical protein FKW77_006274 [Venturia effusa]
MLRLRPTAINLTPNDIQIANERLAARIFHERIQVRRGAERSRDEAIVLRTTRLQAPRQAEISESDDDDLSDTSSESKPQPATLRHRTLAVSDDSSSSDEYLSPHDDGTYQQTTRPDSGAFAAVAAVPDTLRGLSQELAELARFSRNTASSQFSASPGTMSVQRRNLPPYAQTDERRTMFGEDYFRQQLIKASTSAAATDTTSKDEPSPLEIFGLTSWDQWEEQMDWQIGHERGYPKGYTGAGGTRDVVQVERILRRQLATRLINGEIPWRDGPIAAPGPPEESDNARKEIELPGSMQSLRTRPMSSRGVATSRGRPSQSSPVHIPHGRLMAQQHAQSLQDRQYRSPSLRQHPTPSSQRQLTPIGLPMLEQQFSPIPQLTPGMFADPGHAFSPAGRMMTYSQVPQFTPHVPYMPALNRQPTPSAMVSPVVTNQYHAQRRSTPFRQTSPLERISSGSPVSRSASSLSDMMSSAPTSRYAERSDVSMASAPRSSMPTQSIHMPRSRPMSTPHVPTSYERNNQYMTQARTSYGQGGLPQRPTPPPAIGHGRPQLPRWQRNQENSEEAAMSALQGEMERVRIGDQRRDMDGEVMNNTPPHESLMERYLRED